MMFILCLKRVNKATFCQLPDNRAKNSPRFNLIETFDLNIDKVYIIYKIDILHNIPCEIPSVRILRKTQF